MLNLRWNKIKTIQSIIDKMSAKRESSDDSPVMRLRANHNYIPTDELYAISMNPCVYHNFKEPVLNDDVLAAAENINIDDTWTVKSITDKCGGKCAYCGCPLTLKEMTVDYIIPKSKKGGGDLGNLFPSCRSCNILKNNLTVSEFIDRVSELVSKGEYKFYYAILNH